MQFERILVLGETGLAGSAIAKAFRDGGDNVYSHSTRTDLLDEGQTLALFNDVRPDLVVMAAGRVGGIGANLNTPGQFCYENLRMAANVFESARQKAVKQIIYLGSACIYPPIEHRALREDDWLAGAFEPSNRGYAMAKSAAMMLALTYHQQYNLDSRLLMPANLYGPKDRFDQDTGHVIGALITRLTEAKRNQSPQVKVWGDGSARREWLHSADLANAVRQIARMPRAEYDANLPRSAEHFNVGSGVEYSIRELAHHLAELIGYNGQLIFDSSAPTGVTRRLLDSNALKATGWSAKIELKAGLSDIVETYLQFSNASSGTTRPLC